MSVIRYSQVNGLSYDAIVEENIMEGEAVKDIVAQTIAEMTHAEKLELLASLEGLIAEEMAASAIGEPKACPRCGCSQFVKKGHGRDGSQRWLCCGCGRTFGSVTRGLLANSKLDAATWREFVRCTVDHVPLRESARRCGTSLVTAWFMRHRLCEVMASRLVAFQAGQGRLCEVDGMFLRESLSGNWDRSGSFEMPRERHRNGKDVHVRGHSGLQVCIICGVNDLGDAFCEVSNRGEASEADIEQALSGRIAEASVVSTDGKPAYVKPLAGLGVAAHNRYCAKGDAKGNVNMVNSLHSRLREFLAPFHGVSTRRLQHYLDWFCYREQFRKTDADRREITFADAASGRYFTTRREYARTPHPFMEYWSDAAMSTVV